MFNIHLYLNKPIPYYTNKWVSSSRTKVIYKWKFYVKINEGLYAHHLGVIERRNGD